MEVSWSRPVVVCPKGPRRPRGGLTEGGTPLGVHRAAHRGEILTLGLRPKDPPVFTQQQQRLIGKTGGLFVLCICGLRDSVPRPLVEGVDRCMTRPDKLAEWAAGGPALAGRALDERQTNAPTEAHSSTLLMVNSHTYIFLAYVLPRNPQFSRTCVYRNPQLCGTLWFLDASTRSTLLTINRGFNHEPTALRLSRRIYQK